MPRVLPALTLWQPWATLIALGIKPYETRDRRAPSRLIGARIAIHAAARQPKFGDITPEIHDAAARASGDPLWFEKLPFGAVICTAVLTDALPVTCVFADPFGDYTPGRYAWKLERVSLIVPPVPAKGQRLYGWPWPVPDGVAI